MTKPLGARRILPVLISSMVAQSAIAADELLLYVFDSGTAVEGAEVLVDGEPAGRTRRDGSLFIDIDGGGQRVITVTGPDGREQRERFSAGSGQLIDLILDLGGEDADAVVDVYSRTESTADRRDAPTGTLQVTVRRGTEPVRNQLVVISNGQGAVATNESGVATKSLPRGIYRVSSGGVSREVRVSGGVTRGTRLNLPEDDSVISVTVPQIEEVFVLGSFDPSGFEESERDTNLIVDTLGVEELTRFGDSDVAASVVRVPGISVQDDKYVFIRGLGDRYVTSTLNNSTMPSTNPTKRTVPLDLFPSNFVNQLDIKKTFLPFMPGESTGGNLVINTKTFPDERRGSVSSSLGYVSDLTGNTVGVDPYDGDFDYLGWDDGTREENIVVQTIGDIVQNGGRFTDADGDTFTLNQNVLRELQRTAGIELAEDWDLKFEDTLPNGSLGFNYGDLFYLGDGELGFYAAVNYSNSWSQRANGVRRTFSASGIVADDQTYESHSNNIDISGLVSIGLQHRQSPLSSGTTLHVAFHGELCRAFRRSRGGRIPLGLPAHEPVGRAAVFVDADPRIPLSQRRPDQSSVSGSSPLPRRVAMCLTVPMFVSTPRQNLTDPAELRAAFDFSSAEQTSRADLLNGFFISAGSTSKRWDDLIDANFDASFDVTWDLYR